MGRGERHELAGRRAAGSGQRAWDAQAPPCTLSWFFQLLWSTALPSRHDASGRLQWRFSWGWEGRGKGKREGVGQRPKNPGPQTAPGVLHTCHPGFAICFCHCLSRPRVWAWRKMGVPRRSQGHLKNSAHPDYGAPTCVAPGGSSCLAQEVHPLFRYPYPTAREKFCVYCCPVRAKCE